MQSESVLIAYMDCALKIVERITSGGTADGWTNLEVRRGVRYDSGGVPQRVKCSR